MDPHPWGQRLGTNAAALPSSTRRGLGPQEASDPREVPGDDPAVHATLPEGAHKGEAELWGARRHPTRRLEVADAVQYVVLRWPESVMRVPAADPHPSVPHHDPPPIPTCRASSSASHGAREARWRVFGSGARLNRPLWNSERRVVGVRLRKTLPADIEQIIASGDVEPWRAVARCEIGAYLRGSAYEPRLMHSLASGRRSRTSCWHAAGTSTA